MHNVRVAWAASVLLYVASAANAEFVFSTTTTDAGGGDERVELFALNRGNGSGTKALASEITITDESGHTLVTKFKSPSGQQPDVTGVQAPDPYNSDRSFVNLLGDPSGGASGTDNDPTSYNLISFNPPNPAGAHLSPWTIGVTQFQVTGANLSGGVDATAAANGGRGALIAVAVAPSGDAISFSGSIGGDQGGPQSIPEPVGVPILAIGLAAIVRRRCRR